MAGILLQYDLKNAMFKKKKFFITANVKIRAKRRFKEYKTLKKGISFNEVFLKALKNVINWIEQENLDL